MNEIILLCLYKSSLLHLVLNMPLFADVKSMISAGLATVTSCNYELMKNAVLGKQNLNVLCIGHGGGSIPLFLASEIKGY